MRDYITTGYICFDMLAEDEKTGFCHHSRVFLHASVPIKTKELMR